MTGIDVSWPKPESLTDFLLARIAEDEAVAADAATDTMNAPPGVAVATGEWHAVEYPYEGIAVLGWPDDGCDANDESRTPATVHITRQSPARILAECAAKRAIVELLDHQDRILWEAEATGDLDPYSIDPGKALMLLALPYADHPDYREEWRP